MAKKRKKEDEDPAPKPHRHRWVFSTSQRLPYQRGKPTLYELGFMCKARFTHNCVERRERVSTRAEAKQLKERGIRFDRTPPIHKLWHKFQRKFYDQENKCWKWSGYEFMRRLEKWVQKYPDILVVGVDDGHHANSDLVLIPHEDEFKYWGTTVVYIPQCTGEQPIQFFLYPSHLGDGKRTKTWGRHMDLMTALQHTIKKTEQPRKKKPPIKINWKAEE